MSNHLNEERVCYICGKKFQKKDLSKHGEYCTEFIMCPDVFPHPDKPVCLRHHGVKEATGVIAINAPDTAHPASLYYPKAMQE
jgi:hypothetical protein